MAVQLQGGAMALLMVSLWWVLEYWQRFKAWMILVLLPASIYIGPIIASRANEQERIQFYKLCFEYFKNHVEIWTGAGLESFIYLGPKIQREANFYMGEKCFNGKCWWLSMHSDVLQYTMEVGIIGIMLMGVVYSTSIWWGSRASRTSLIMLAPCLAGYFPMRVPVFACFIIWVISLSQNKKGEKCSSLTIGRPLC
jgi:hypothetical protein